MIPASLKAVTNGEVEPLAAAELRDESSEGTSKPIMNTPPIYNTKIRK